VPSILILIPSFWKQTYHKCHYLCRVWCRCPISKKGERRMSREVLGRRQHINTWSWKNEDKSL